MEERIFHCLMRELCQEMGIKMEKLSYDWILQLTNKKGKVRHITGNRFDLNPEASGDIACDKYATYEVLSSQNVPVVKHTMLFNPATRSKFIPDGGNSLKIISEFLTYGKVVVKPNSGCEGIGVSLCHTLKEAEIAIQKLFKTGSSISICPYYDIETEYRTFYLNGEVKLIYGKTKPFVVGDGKSTMAELVEKLDLPDKGVVKDNLSHIDFDYIPKENEKVEISWKHNLSGGATPKVLEKSELYDNIANLAIQAGHAMNMNFATIDVIQTTDGNLYVLEVNSGVCGTIFINSVEGGYEILKDIYRKSLEALFE